MTENEPGESAIIRSLRRKRILAIVVLLFPAGVLIATAIISSVNEQRQFQSVKLPAIFLYAYAIAVLCSPIVGISILWNLRRKNVATLADDERQRWAQFRLLAAATLLAPIVWVIGFVTILFATGFSR